MEDKKAMSPASLEALRRFRASGGKIKRVRGERTPREAIRAHCRECAGSPAGVTLCTGGDCPLWEWRLGRHYSAPASLARVESAWKHFKSEAAEVENVGLNLAFYTALTPKERLLAVNRALNPSE